MRYQSTSPKRRFLAGVSCPKCAKMDVVVQVQLFEPTPDEYIECTQCGHTERRPDADDIAAKNALEIETLQTGTQGQVRFIE